MFFELVGQRVALALNFLLSFSDFAVRSVMDSLFPPLPIQCFTFCLLTPCIVFHLAASVIFMPTQLPDILSFIRIVIRFPFTCEICVHQIPRLDIAVDVLFSIDRYGRNGNLNLFISQSLLHTVSRSSVINPYI